MIKREILSKIIPWLGKEKILILKGSRQVGKTTLLKKIKNYLENDNKKVVYLLADDLDNESIFRSTANLELYLKQFHNFQNEFIYLIIDEFQVIDNAGVFLKNIFDKYQGKIQLIVSGSSSLEINRNSEFLTGRAIHFDINRVSFYEFFNFKNNTEIKKHSLKDFSGLKDFYTSLNSQSKLDLSFIEYNAFGAYPEILTLENIEEKKILLKNIVKTYIEKDIINQLKIENISGFNNLLKILSSQVGNLVNFNELTNTTGLATNTLKKYVDILKGTYIFDLITPYYKNIRSETSKMPKAYILDLGIKKYLLRNLEFDMQEAMSGEDVENFVYLTLLESFAQDHLHFYRTISGSEIDFVIEKENKKVILLEVKYRGKVNIPLAVKNFSNKYNDIVDEKVVVTKDFLHKEDDVYFIPVKLLPFVDLDGF